MVINIIRGEGLKFFLLNRYFYGFSHVIIRKKLVLELLLPSFLPNGCSNIFLSFMYPRFLSSSSFLIKKEKRKKKRETRCIEIEINNCSNGTFVSIRGFKLIISGELDGLPKQA